MDYERLFSPLAIGKATIKNRVVLSPMLLGFGRFDGRATERMLDYYEARAAGGAGLVITEIARVNDLHGAGAFAQLGASQDYQVEGLAELTRRVQRHGAKLFVQLHHPGRQNVGLLVGSLPLTIALDRRFKGFAPMLYRHIGLGKKLLERNLVPASVCPSKVEPSYFSGGRVRALRRGEIEGLVRDFVAAAARVQRAGCDGVELHGSHGYLIQQFLSPHTNRRSDEYGGSFEKRMRFVSEIVHGIRRECGDFPLVVRMSADECYDRIGRPGVGYGLEEGLRIARALEALGVDALDVSSASYDAFNYWLEPTSFECGWRSHLAEAVKAAVSIPVIAANLIRSPEQAERQLAEGIQDFVSLGRPHIADPEWANKAREGRAAEIKRCCCCLACIESMEENAWSGGHARCSVNPGLGHEGEGELPRDGAGRRVVVVGAGIAGLACAELLGRRGFSLLVLESGEEAGGQLLLAAAPPRKGKMRWVVEDARSAALRAGAELRLGRPATKEGILALEPYAVLVATGGEAIRPRSIPGVSGPNVFTTTELLSGATKLKGKKVALVGSGMTGLETAELLVEGGNSVTVVEMASSLAPGAWFQHRDDALPRLRSAGTDFLLGRKLVAVEGEGILVEEVAGGRRSKLACDAVVLSLGVRPENALYKELAGLLPRVYALGDAVSPGRIADATAAAYRAAAELPG